MKAIDNVIHADRETEALVLGSLGVLGFSFSFPATWVAVQEIDSIVVGFGRAIGAALVAAVVLVWKRERLPPRNTWVGIAFVAGCAVIGSPVTAAIALREVPSSHGAIVFGIVPTITALIATLRAGEKPRMRFWIACAGGIAATFAFAMAEGGGAPCAGDAWLALSVAFAACSYAEGARVARQLGGLVVLSWALVLAAPLLILPVSLRIAEHGFHASPRALLGFGYVSIISMYVAFVAWYRGLAIGGIAKTSQLQLVQPALTVVWSWLFLGEPMHLRTILAGAAVLASAAVCRWAANGSR